MVYATVEEVEAGFRTLSDDEKTLCSALLAEAGIVIDAYSQDAPFERKQLVSCRMVRRQLDAGTGGQGAAMLEGLGENEAGVGRDGGRGETLVRAVPRAADVGGNQAELIGGPGG